MRRMRWFLVLPLFLLVGCLNLELRVKVFQDGSGVYTESVEFGEELLKLALNQSGPFNSFNDLLADAANKALLELQGVDGVTLLDIRGQQVEHGRRIVMVYRFDSLEQWNAYAKNGKKPKLQMATTAVPKKGKNPAATAWTLQYSPVEIPLSASIGDPNKMPKPDPNKLPDNIGGFRLMMAGPQPATEAPAAPGESIQVGVENGEVVFSGSFNDFITIKNDLAVRFEGQPMTAAALEEAKKELFVEPSAEYRRILELVTQLRERQAVDAAAAAAIAGGFISLRVTIRPDGKVQWESARTFYGPTAAVLAGREALLQSMLPEASAAYRLTVEVAKNEIGQSGIAVIRRRIEPLAVEDLAPWLTAKRDGKDWVYTLQIGRLLNAALPEAGALGEVIVETPDPVIGANGETMEPRRVRLTLTAADLAMTQTLVVRTAKAH